MIRKAYSASAVKLPFWFMEFKKEVCLLSEGKTFDDIKIMSLSENLFGAPTTMRARQIYLTVTSRIQNLDSGFYQMFQMSDIATQKLFALSALMAQDTLFFDFVYEVVRDKIITGSNEYSDTDLRLFFRNKQLQDKTVAKWTDQTIHRLGVAYKNYLMEAGITDNKRIRTISKPIVDPALEQWLKDHGMKEIYYAITGEKRM